MKPADNAHTEHYVPVGSTTASVTRSELQGKQPDICSIHCNTPPHNAHNKEGDPPVSCVYHTRDFA